MIVVVDCDRCGKQVTGIVTPTGNYKIYPVEPGEPWAMFGRDGERVICDDCLFADPDYIRYYGLG